MYLNFSISTPSENILPFYAVEAALLPCGGQLIAKVNEVDTLFSPGELILLARLHQHTSFHFLFKIEIFFHTTYILHSPLPMDVALTSYQPFHKIQNHEQDLNIFRQIIKIFLGQLHQHTLFYFQDFNLFSPQFKTLIKIVKWRDFSIAPCDLTWKLAIKLTTDRPANISALHELFSSNLKSQGEIIN